MIIDSGLSTKNSISFRKGSIASMASYDENGQIKLSSYFITTNSNNVKDGYNQNKPINGIKWLAITSGILNLFIYSFELSKWYMIAMIAILIAYQIFMLKCHDKEDESLKNHAVEHKIINQVNIYGRSVTMDDIVKSKVMTPHCGSSLLLIYIVFKLIAFCISVSYNVIVPEIIVYSLFKNLYCTFPIYYIGYIAQNMDMRKPTEKNYKLGKAALENFFKLTDEIKNIQLEENVKYIVIEEKNLEDVKVSLEDPIVKATSKIILQKYEEEILKMMESEDEKKSNKRKKESKK